MKKSNDSYRMAKEEKEIKKELQPCELKNHELVNGYQVSVSIFFLPFYW